MSIKGLQIRVYDIITVLREGETRDYEVLSVNLGGLNQESLIGMASWSAIPNMPKGEEMMVPEWMIQSLVESGKASITSPINLGGEGK